MSMEALHRVEQSASLYPPLPPETAAQASALGGAGGDPLREQLTNDPDNPLAYKWPLELIAIVSACLQPDSRRRPTMEQLTRYIQVEMDAQLRIAATSPRPKSNLRQKGKR